jgi:hypothetical protein
MKSAGHIPFRTRSGKSITAVLNILSAYFEVRMNTFGE